MPRFNPSLLLLFLALLIGYFANSQLCTGSLGDPVVHITFGAGANPGPAAGNNNYQFLGQDCPNDGQYTVRNSTSSCFFNSWHSLGADHTGDPSGYFMLVNASFQPGDFFKQQVDGLCGNTTYEFAAWVNNVLRPFACGGVGIKPNLTFSIETTSGGLIATYNTGDLPSTDGPQWKQYGMFFTTPSNTSTVVVRLRNNAPGGCGNDLALDDITFRPCGAEIKARIEGVEDGKLALCEGTQAAYQMTASITTEFFEPEMQWQETKDSGATWTAITGATGLQYQWTPGAAGTYGYRMVVAEKGNINSAACRVASQVLEITVHPLPKIVVENTIAVCNGAQLQLSASLDFGGVGAGNYRWQMPTGADLRFSEEGASGLLRLQNDAVVAAPGFAGSYILTAENAAGCVNKDTIDLSVLEQPVASFSLPAGACAGVALLLNGSGTISTGTISEWHWQWDGGDAATQNATLLFPQSGQQTIRFAVRANNGCVSDTLVQALSVNPTPEVSFLLPEICLTDPFAQFKNTSTVEGGERLAYRWVFGDPANPAASSTDKDARYRYGRTGRYEVGLTATSASGCTADTIEVFTVNGASPLASYSITNAGVLCSADSVRLRNEARVDFGNITRLEIFWTGANRPDAVTIDEDPVPRKIYAFSYARFVTNNTNRFTVRYRVYSGIGCVDETSDELVLNKSPEVTLSPIEAVCAYPSPLSLTGGTEQTGQEGGGVYFGPGVAPSGLFDPSIAGAGSHQLGYRFTTVAGCIASVAQPVQVFPVPQVSAGPDRTLIAGGAITLQASAVGSGLQYLWLPGMGLNDARVLQPEVRITRDQLYRLRVTSAEGCIAEDETMVKVVPDLYIPNAFTPNGDGRNDTWQVPYLESVAGGEVQVFNRYGQVVFRSTGGQKWDGRFNGLALPNGAYVYMVKYYGKIKKGTVLLIR